MGAKNLKTGHRIEIELTSKNWFSDSSLEGKCYDGDGKLVYELSGSWKDQIKMRNVKTSKEFVVWKENL